MEALLQQAVAQQEIRNLSASINMDIFPNCCVGFDLPNYEGDFKMWCLEEWNDGYAEWDIVQEFNDKVSSWKCGKNARMDLCHAKLSNSCGGFQASGGAGLAENPRHGYNNAASSVRMWAYDQYTDRGAAMLYENADCEGFSVYIESGLEGEIRSYTNRQLTQNHIRANNLSSVQVPLGYTLTLFDDGNMGGEREVIHGQVNDDGTMVCYNLQWMEDRQNSATMVKDVQPNAKGRWTQIGTGTGAHSWEYGFIPQVNDVEPRELFEKLRMEIAQGVSIEDSFGEAIMTGHELDKLIKVTAPLYELDHGMTNTIFCPSPQFRSDDQVAAYVWMVESDDGKSRMVSDRAMCRYGDDIWDETPTCPYLSCIDNYCTRCKQYY